MKKHSRYLLRFLLVCMGMMAILCVKPVSAQAASMRISKVKVSAPKSGSTYASSSITYATSSCKKLKMRIRVLNRKGKYVYQQTLSNLSRKGTKKVIWNGKASVGNAAKLTAGALVPNGTYRIEVYLSGKAGKKNRATTKRTSFKVSRKTATSPSPGTTPNTTPNTTPSDNTVLPTEGMETTASGVARLTGDAQLDYMAEMMLREAGVTASMSAEEKVQRIYYWVSHEFKHVHDSHTNYKKYYALNALSSEIKAYRASTDRLVAEGKAQYVKLIYCAGIKYSTGAYTDSRHASFQNTAKLWFNSRVGQCNRTADAFMILCNHAGIEGGVCAGYYLNSNGTKSGHYWNWLKLGGEVYYYDVDVQLQNNAKGFRHPYYERWYKADRTMALRYHQFTHGLQN